MSRFVSWSWSRINTRFRILATDEESAYYAWVDEYLDRLKAEAAVAKPALRRSKKESTIDGGASV